MSSWLRQSLERSRTNHGPIKDQLMFWPPTVTYQSIKCSTISESIEPIAWSIKPKLCLTTCLGFQTLFKALNFFVFVRVLNLLWLLFEPWGSVFSNLHINWCTSVLVYLVLLELRFHIRIFWEYFLSFLVTFVRWAQV